jgi:hypothetical protein
MSTPVFNVTPDQLQRRRSAIIATTGLRRVAALYSLADRYELSPSQWDAYEEVRRIDSLLDRDPPGSR